MFNQAILALKSCICQGTDLHKKGVYLDTSELQPLFVVKVLVECLETGCVEEIDEGIAHIAVILRLA